MAPMASNQRSNISDFADPGLNGVVYFAYLESLTAQFDLIVGASQKVESSIVKHTHQVAGTVDTLAVLLAGRKPLIGQIGPVQVSLSDEPPGHA